MTSITQCGAKFNELTKTKYQSDPNRIGADQGEQEGFVNQTAAIYS
jgi:hypothetical protein